MHDLALQVREIDHVIVDDAKSSDPRGAEIEQQRRAQPARAHHQDARRHQLRLPLLADLVEDQVPCIALKLRFGEVHGAFVFLGILTTEARRRITSPLSFVMAGLVPAIHVFKFVSLQPRGCPAQGRA